MKFVDLQGARVPNQVHVHWLLQKLLLVHRLLRLHGRGTVGGLRQGLGMHGVAGAGDDYKLRLEASGCTVQALEEFFKRLTGLRHLQQRGALREVGGGRRRDRRADRDRKRLLQIQRRYDGPADDRQVGDLFLYRL